MINFRGITGATQASEVSLLGRAGVQDAGELVAAMQWALDALTGGASEFCGGGDGGGDGSGGDGSAPRPWVGTVGPKPI